jgi:putative lipoic acid-binding regulatory protein
MSILALKSSLLEKLALEERETDSLHLNVTRKSSGGCYCGVRVMSFSQDVTAPTNLHFDMTDIPCFNWRTFTLFFGTFMPSHSPYIHPVP